MYINPKYTSKTCYNCGAIGNRARHKFACKECGTETHADHNNASLNMVSVAKGKTLVKGGVNMSTVEQTANSCSLLPTSTIGKWGLIYAFISI